MFQIGGHQIGGGAKTFLIAEIAQAHDGSLGTAHAYIDAAADAGVQAIKFQTHIAAEESTLDEPFRVRFSRQDETRFAYWKRMEFTEEQWRGLSDHARDRGLVFLSSPFSVAAVALLSRIGIPAWKIGSGEFRSKELLDAICATGNPVLLSTGMSTWDEIAEGAALLKTRSVPFALFQCTSKYPTPLTEVGLNVLDELRQRFACPVGLSDHSGTAHPALAAIARGCEIVEVHFVIDRRLFGPDVPASLDPSELRLLADFRDAVAEMDAHPADKDAAAHDLSAMRAAFTKSIAPASHLTAGTILAEKDLVPRKPGSGIPYSERQALIGRKLLRDVSPDRLLRPEDVEGGGL